MIITLSIAYYFYLIIVGLYLLFGFFNLYHLLKFGFVSFTNLAVMLIFIALSCWLITFSFSVLRAIDWQTPLLDLSDLNNWFDGTNFFPTTFK